MESEFKVGETVMGEVVGVKPYGAFIKLPNEDIGMVHISEVAEEYVKEIHDYLKIGQEVPVKIIGLQDEGKYNLSLKDMSKQDEETAQFSQEVREAQQLLADQHEAIIETAWKRPKIEDTQPKRDEHADFLDWVKEAKNITHSIYQRSENRQRKIDSINF